MPWYDAWGLGPWILVPILMCIGMMVMMMLMSRGHMGRRDMGWCGGGRMNVEPSDTALETLRQRLASGELTQQEYGDQQRLLERD